MHSVHTTPVENAWRRVWASIAAVALVIGLVVSGSSPAVADDDADLSATTTMEESETTSSPETPALGESDEQTQEPGLLPEGIGPDEGEQTVDAELGLPGFELFAVGPDGAQPPYIYWDVKNSADGSLTGGAEFELQGPRNSNSSWWGEWGVSWSDSVTVQDCVEGPCTGTDLDPDPGEFLVKQIDGHDISSSNRYRLRQTAPPSGYVFTASDAWKEVPGDRNTPTGWSSGTFDFETFTVRKIPPQSPVCEAGYVYGIRANGQIVQVSPSGTVTTLGSPAPSNSSFNGLGVGTGGSPVYGYARDGRGASGSRPLIFEFDTQSGQWSSTGVRIPQDHTYGVTFIAGAVSLNNGNYYLGGYVGSDDDRVFRLWEYSPTSHSITYKGEVKAPGGGRSNGDIAFNSAGDLFIVRGSGNSTWVYSVTADNLEAASGGRIPSSSTKEMENTSNDVNGVAFDADGKGYLGSNTTATSYDMPNWSGKADVTNSLQSSTDLASCSSPATITIEKYVQGGRVADSDQFELELKEDGKLLGSAVTTGTATGVQEEQIGPLPTRRGVTLNFSEKASGSTDLSKYASSYSCEVDGEPLVGAAGTGTTGNVTIPQNGEAVVCRITNSPVVADVTVSKYVTDALGNNPRPRQNWTVNAKAEASAGSVTADPSATAQQTNSNGDAKWKLTFGTAESRANLSLSEESQEGYEFQEGQCLVKKLDGSVTETQLDGPNSQTLTGISPGDSVECRYVNKPSPGSFIVTKAFENVPDGFGDIDFTGTYACTLDGDTVAEGTWTRQGNGEATLTPSAEAIPVSAQCSATENPPAESDGLPNDSWVWNDPTISQPVTIVSGKRSEIKVTNSPKRIYGKLAVKKVLDGTADPDFEYRGGFRCNRDGEKVSGSWGPILAGETWTSAEEDRIPLGAECEVSEADLIDPPVNGDPSYSWGDPEISDPVVIERDIVHIITVTNKTVRQLGSVVWSKVDPDGALLEGSEWTIEGPGFENDTVVEDCTAEECNGLDKDARPGHFKLSDLLWGDYQLTESKAPAGYERIAGVHEFTIGGGGQESLAVNIGAIENKKREGPTIPLTGGIGRDLFTILGAGILALGILGALIRAIRRRNV